MQTYAFLEGVSNYLCIFLAFMSFLLGGPSQLLYVFIVIWPIFSRQISVYEPSMVIIWILSDL
jgi:hypothetical protein